MGAPDDSVPRVQAVKNPTRLTVAALLAFSPSAFAEPGAPTTVAPDSGAVATPSAASAPLLSQGQGSSDAPASLSRLRTQLLTAGGLVFGLAYAGNLAALIASAISNRGGSPLHEGWLVVPGLGPAFQMVKTQNPLGNVVLAGDALTELAGIAMIAYGATLPAPPSSEPGVSLAPLLGPGRAGLGVTGRF
jgi:hypothetical protein